MDRNGWITSVLLPHPLGRIFASNAARAKSASLQNEDHARNCIAAALDKAEEYAKAGVTSYELINLTAEDFFALFRDLYAGPRPTTLDFGQALIGKHCAMAGRFMTIADASLVFLWASKSDLRRFQTAKLPASASDHRWMRLPEMAKEKYFNVQVGQSIGRSLVWLTNHVNPPSDFMSYWPSKADYFVDLLALEHKKPKNTGTHLVAFSFEGTFLTVHPHFRPATFEAADNKRWLAPNEPDKESFGKTLALKKFEASGTTDGGLPERCCLAMTSNVLAGVRVDFEYLGTVQTLLGDPAPPSIGPPSYIKSEMYATALQSGIENSELANVTRQ